jgi:deoxycytidylate deaminase
MILKRNEYIAKNKLEELLKKGLTSEQISKELKVSIYKIKNSLIEYQLFCGKVYNFICEGCNKPFSHYIKGYKFCSNKCKHRHQLIWNRGKNKFNNKKIQSLSRFALGNKWGILKSEKLSDLLLPHNKINIKYNSRSKSEMNFLLSLDQEKDLLNVKRCDFIIPYIDNESGQQRNYIPDFLVTWKTGLQWIVEIKGILHLNELDKIIAGQKYAENNNMRYRLITPGFIKYNMWDQFYLHTSHFLIPSKEFAMMANACCTSLFSCDITRRVGCIITSTDFIHLFSFGYNGDEKNGPNISHTFERGKTGFIHAEENALLKLKTKEDAIMFITDAPCELCAKKIINSENIKEIYYLRDYRDMSGIGMLISHGIKTYKFQLLDNRLTPLSDEIALKKLLPGGIYEEEFHDLFDIAKD